MSDMENDGICAECANRLKCLVEGMDLATDIIVDGFNLRQGCWVATGGMRRVQIVDSPFGVYGWDPDASSIVEITQVKCKRRIPAPENDLRCPYCGIIVYHLLPHLETCRKFNKRK